MNARLISLAVLAATLATAGFSADEAPAKKPARNEALRAKMVEDAKIQAAKPTTPAATKPNSSPAKAPGAPAEPAAPASASATATPTEPSPPTKASEEPATVLPQIEVNRSKLHPLARELYEKEKEIAREKELTKPTELDKALNHPKISVPLFGGQSTSSRASVASERTSLLQAEADLIEEIGRAKTKEQKDELRQQLDALKKIRRELEHTIR
jgi:hypothetical protein